VRKVVEHFAGAYSVAITRDEIEGAIAAAHIEADAKRIGGADKFFIGSFSTRALGKK
jgi:hypothetical protein